MNRLAAVLTPWLIALAALPTDSRGAIGTLQAEDQFNLGIVAALCKREPTSFPFAGGDCAPAEGAVIVVTTSEGQLVGTCIAQAKAPEAVTAGCSVSVPFGASVVVTQDVSTIPAGYAPAYNPQPFDVPTGPPDGVVGGPVFLNLPTGQSGTDSTDTAVGGTPNVALIGDPSWWVVPFAPGYGNSEDGNLYFGVLVENLSPAPVSVMLSFRAYRIDGTPHSDCSRFSPLDLGSGAAASIPPAETAWVTCKGRIVPAELGDLQTTVRLDDVTRLDATAGPALDLSEVEFTSVPRSSSPMLIAYRASALVAAGSGDTEARLRFQFYDERGVLVAACESGPVLIEPEVPRRVRCSGSVLIDTGSPQPATVNAEVLSADG